MSQKLRGDLLLHLKKAIPEVQDCTLMSDRDNGLLQGEAVLGFRVVTAYYCPHLLDHYYEELCTSPPAALLEDSTGKRIQRPLRKQWWSYRGCDQLQRTGYGA